MFLFFLSVFLFFSCHSPVTFSGGLPEAVLSTGNHSTFFSFIFSMEWLSPSRRCRRTCPPVFWSAAPSRWGNHSPDLRRCWTSWESWASRPSNRFPRSRKLAASRKGGPWGRCRPLSDPVQDRRESTVTCGITMPTTQHFVGITETQG